MIVTHDQLRIIYEGISDREAHILVEPEEQIDGAPLCMHIIIQSELIAI